MRGHLDDAAETAAAITTPATAVFGASGFIGRKLFSELLRRNAGTFGTCASRPLEGAVNFDLRSDVLAGMRLLLAPVQYAVVACGMTRIDPCRVNPELSRTINVTGTIRLVDFLSATTTVPVFLSTDYVYRGDRGAYSENDKVEPKTLYGRQKVEVEAHIRETCKRHLILRLGKVFGVELGDGTLLTSWAAELAQGHTVRCADDTIFCPSRVDDIVTAILTLIRYGSSGTFNVCGPEAVTHFQLATRLAEFMRIENPRIEKCRMADFGLIEPRPANVSMDSSKFARMTGFTFTPLDESLKLVARSMSGE